MLDAAALAAILDPERKVPGWWKAAPIKCGNGSRDGVRDIYTGHANLHTAREYAWRMEDWLTRHGCEITMTSEWTYVEGPAKTGFVELALKPNHTAALVAAIERIVNG